MLLSLNILKKYLDFPKSVTPEDIHLALTKCTVEVERIVYQAEGMDKIIVGRVGKTEKHKDADRLSVVEVEIGKNRTASVVCGGTNLKQGMLVAFAPPGSLVRWHGEGELVELEKAKIRGVESFGMICAADEIGLDNRFFHAKGEILDLSPLKLKVGASLANTLGLDDVIIEIDNKSLTNRPDLWSHYGVARELSVIFGLKFKSIKLYDKRFKSAKKELEIKVLEKTLCPRYIGAVINNVSVKESPAWLKKELSACGLRPINNIVDVTNYVLIELGQPMHAFDFNKLKSQSQKLKSKKQKFGENKAEIVVRLAKPEEKILTLDEVERRLDKDNLVIADSEKPVALAGIMGGLDSGIDENTKRIVLEAANFDSVCVRKTSQKFGLRTESSIRYEKSLHPRLAELGMRRAIELLQAVDPEIAVSEILDKNHFKEKDSVMAVDYNFIVKRIGLDIGSNSVVKILKDLGFSPVQRKDSDKVKLTVPWWRATGDVSIPEDIVEEVARIYGYDRLLEKPELVNLERAKYQPRFDFELKIKNILSLGCGMSEVYNYPWLDTAVLEKLQSKRLLKEILNPSSEKNKFLQSSLVFNLAKNVEDNLRFFDNFRIFELARVFLPVPAAAGKFDGSDVLPDQPFKIAGALVGDKKNNLFFDAKGIISEIISLIDSSALFLKTGSVPNYISAEKSQVVFLFGKAIGFVGCFKDQIAQKFDFHNKEVVVFEIDFDALVEPFKDKPIRKYRVLPKYPSVTRDLAVKVSYATLWQELSSKIRNIDPLVKQIEFLSVYDLGGGKKSVGFRIRYQDLYRTLEESEAVSVEKKILKYLAENFGAEER